MERQERQVLRLGDPGRQCLGNRRSDGRLRVSRAVRKHAATTLAPESGLHTGASSDRRDVEVSSKQATGLSGW